MSEPYRPGGEHCPKCGYRHDGRCDVRRSRLAALREFQQADHGVTEPDQAFLLDEIDRLREELRVAQSTTSAVCVEAGSLRNFARLLWAYYQTWQGTRSYAEMAVEARKLGIVEEASDEPRCPYCGKTDASAREACLCELGPEP